MIRRSLVALAALSLAPLAWAQAPNAMAPTGPVPPDPCLPHGAFTFICGQGRAEDLLLAPGGGWVVASWIDGGLHAVNTETRATTKLYPAPGAGERFDRATYDLCPGAPTAQDKAQFALAGLALRPLPQNGMVQVHAVNMGRRAGIDVFELDLRGRSPAATWVGCVPAPTANDMNSVAPLPGGGLIATEWMPRDAQREVLRARMYAGEIVGDTWTWRTGQGWTTLPIAQASGANGLELSPDGGTLFVSSQGARKLIRVALATGKRDEIDLPFRSDNVHWAPDGQLLLSGFEDATSHVVKVDPAALTITELVNRPNDAAFDRMTTAVQVGGELWIGSSRTRRIAIAPLPK